MKIIFSLFLLTAINLDLSAHAYIEDPQWCSSDQTVSIGNVTLTQEQLETSLETGVICSIDPVDAETFPPLSSHSQVLNFISPVIFSPARDHGIMDIPQEQYQIAIAYSYCACSSLNGSENIDPSEVRPELITSRLTGSNHHSLYTYTDGLSFSCHVCVVNEVAPPPR
jgi:hypothetical protein